MKTTIIASLLIATACILELVFGVRELGQWVALIGLTGCLYAGCFIAARSLVADHLKAWRE